jgi:ABC-2 type transport system permease protein
MNRLHTIQFIRSKTALAGALFLLVAGFISLYIGKTYLQKEQEKTNAVAAYQQQHIKRTLQYENKEMGLTLYYLHFAYINTNRPLTGLSIGQRDVNLSTPQVTIRNLEEKKYDTDLQNPASQVLGNFDFSFVLIYLFPLLIIAFCYNLLSEEKEGGTWAMVGVQSPQPLRFLWQKLKLRFMFSLCLLGLLYMMAIPWLDIPVNEALLAMLLLSIGYLAFWFATCAWVVSLKRNSSTNAALLLSIWLLLLVMLPAAVNHLVTRRYPVPEALATAVANRDGYHRKWDESKEATMEKFYAHYPQFKKYTLPKKEFSWLWYYAMQQMGDDDAAMESGKLRGKLLQREQFSETMGYFIPSIHTQLQSNALAQSGLQNRILFLDSLTAFHEQKRLYFYPLIFEDKPVLQEDWAQHTVAFYRQPQQVKWIKIMLPPLLAAVLLSMLAVRRFKKEGYK